MLNLRERMEEKNTAPPHGEGKRSAAAPVLREKSIRSNCMDTSGR